MKLALKVKNKFGFVNGSCVRPSENEILGKQRDRCNSVVLSWILNSISEELYVGQVYSTLATEAWLDLKETYDKIDGSVIFNIHQKINSLTQNGSSVSEYYHKLTSMWKQFDATVQLPTCSCNASREFNDFNHLIKLMQFLMGLDDIYQPVRTNLLTRDPLPTVKVAFSIISREESHRSGSSSSGTKGQSVSFSSKSNQSFSSNNNKKFGRGSNPNIPKCTHCNLLGHPVEKCYELVGYPPNFKKKTNQGFKSNNSVTNNNKGGQSSSPQQFTPEQVSKLLSLVNQVEAKSSESCASGVGGNVMSKFSCSSLSDLKLINDWVIDSGANQHMVKSDTNLINSIDVSEYNVTVSHPNGTKAKVTKIGDIRLINNIVLTSVLVVPDYCVNLISVHKLVKDNKLEVVFTIKNCYIQDLQSRKILVTGRQSDGLYLCVKDVVSMKVCLSKSQEYSMWHSRLGHPSDEVLKVLKNYLNIETTTNTSPCEICHKAKQTRNPFPLSDHVSKQVGDLVHLDLWGPYKVTSFEGFKYFLTIVDDYSRSVWCYLQKTKDEVFSNITNFYELIKTQFDKNIKVFRSDNGTEFVNKSFTQFCIAKGIFHQTSCVYTPQQNGIVERKHRHLLNVAQSLLFQGGLPLKYWSECILTAVYLINRTPSSVLGGRSPYEVMFGFQAPLTHLRNFGCLCYSTILNNHNKFSSKADKCVLIGYSILKKGYKLLDLETNTTFFSRDVKFYEDIFPFKDSIKSDFLTNKDCNTLNFFDLSNSKILDGENPNDEGAMMSQTLLNTHQQPSNHLDAAGKAGSASQPSSRSENNQQLHHQPSFRTENQQPNSSIGPRQRTENSSQQPSSSRMVSSEYIDSFEPVWLDDDVGAGIQNRDYDETSQYEGTSSATGVHMARPIRTSSRTSTFPHKYDDFIIEGKVKYGIEKGLNV
ncbi:hypothetical protein E3N88_05330 [Mikania micrantha]|uniref:Integrase catalytic domain-containing protein n=1 Tax=Mikania micrantha TaxID=192012 RepID=A0A5N6PKN1_9ASTR|nr:hypothetical protein E3N88_05330 [Mikania micrantha]